LSSSESPDNDTTAAFAIRHGKHAMKDLSNMAHHVHEKIHHVHEKVSKNPEDLTTFKDKVLYFFENMLDRFTHRIELERAFYRPKDGMPKISLEKRSYLEQFLRLCLSLVGEALIAAIVVLELVLQCMDGVLFHLRLIIFNTVYPKDSFSLALVILSLCLSVGGFFYLWNHLTKELFVSSQVSGHSMNSPCAVSDSPCAVLESGSVKAPFSENDDDVRGFSVKEGDTRELAMESLDNGFSGHGRLETASLIDSSATFASLTALAAMLALFV